jgi:hypothetical protein
MAYRDEGRVSISFNADGETDIALPGGLRLPVGEIEMRFGSIGGVGRLHVRDHADHPERCSAHVDVASHGTVRRPELHCKRFIDDCRAGPEGA